MRSAAQRAVLLLGLVLWASGAEAAQKRLTVALSWKNLPRSEGQEVYAMGSPIDPVSSFVSEKEEAY